MRKNELVHLHTLLIHVAEDFLERGVATPEAFDAYRTLDVTPTSLRASRDRHEAAVTALGRALADAARGTDDSDSGRARQPRTEPATR
jgi:hypothetical protein